MEKEAPVSSRPPRLTTQGFRQSNSCVIGQELWHWYCSTRAANGGKLSKAMVQARAKWAFHQAGMVDFKASDGWYRRWIHRWRNSDTTFETENVVVQKIQQTEQTNQTDGGIVVPQQQQEPSTITQPEHDETESSAVGGNLARSLPSGDAHIEIGPPHHAEGDDSNENARSEEEEMLDYWSSFLNFGSADSDQGCCAELFDSDFPVDMDELASAFLCENEEPAARRQRKRGERYLPRFKEKVLSYLSSHGVKTAADKFRVHAETVSRWKKSAAPATERDATPEPARTSADRRLLAWLRRCRVRRIGITPAELRDKVARLTARGDAEPGPRWFVMWTQRLGRELVYEEGMELLDRQTRNIQYPKAFKREVAALAEHKSQISVARLFNVSRRRVSEWSQAFAPRPDEGDEDEGEPAEKKEKVFRITDADVDRQLWAWYQGQSPRPNSNQVRAKGLELYHSKGHATMSCSHGWYRRWSARYNMPLCHSADDRILQWALTQLEANQTLTHQSVQAYALGLMEGKRAGFKASSGWVLRFCRRHPALLQSVPTLTTPLPPPLLGKVGRFRRTFRETVRSLSLSPSVIGNVDELHLTFASPTGVRGRAAPLLRKSPMDRCHATVVLACLADGNMLPPAVILKGNPETLPPASNLLVLYQEEARLDDGCLAAWLSRVWFRLVPAPNLLIADCYAPHCTPAVKQAFTAHESTLKVITGGCASRLQPLEVAVKQTFHNLMEKQWKKVNAQPSTSLESPWENVGKFEMPSLSNILEWVNSAYENIQTTKQETIRRSYLVTGLTVSPNHSEDHFIDNMSTMPRDVDE